MSQAPAGAKTGSPEWARADMAAAEAIATAHAAAGAPIIVGLAGAQGSGKSTMAPRLRDCLALNGVRAAVLSLDDFYLTHAERNRLARTVHPLLATRGVPGTHDVAILVHTLDRLVNPDGPAVPIPCFDKAEDDRADRSGWRCLALPFDVIILEGWCIGARPQSAFELATPVNALERLHDANGQWRGWVNDQLAGVYKELFQRLALRLLLRAPSFEVVLRWRSEQEETLARLTGRRGMNDEELQRFIAHYERITRSMLDAPPADLVIALDEDRLPRL